MMSQVDNSHWNVCTLRHWWVSLVTYLTGVSSSRAQDPPNTNCKYVKCHCHAHNATDLKTKKTNVD